MTSSPRGPSQRRVWKAICSKSARSFQRRLRRWGSEYLVSLRSSSGQNALHCACREGRMDLVSCLLRAGTSAAERDSDGCTPLHLAMRWCPTDDIANFRRNYLEPMAASCSDEDLLLAKDSHGRCCVDYLQELREERQRADAAMANAEEEAEAASSRQSFSERLLEECANEVREQGLYSRYNDDADSFQERSSETFDEWCERLTREFRERRTPRQVPPPRRPPPSSRPRLGYLKPPIEAEPKAVDLSERLEEEIATSERKWAVVSDGVDKLGYRDIPWPTFLPDLAKYGDAVLGEEARLTCLKALQRRWHPDRFNQKLGDRLEPDDAERVHQRVLELSQICNGLLEK